MNNNDATQCKTKGCNNPVLDGKHCVNCKLKRKERRDKVIKAAGSVVSLGIIAAINIKNVIRKDS